MITARDKFLAEQFAELAEEYDEAQRRHNEGMALTETLKHSLEFERHGATREERLEHALRVAADKIRMNDAAGALITLETAMRRLKR